MDDEPESPEPRNPAPPAGSRRLLRLAGMTATLAGRYASHAVGNVFRNAEEREQARGQLSAAAGEHLAQTLGELKGAVMKLGQIASQAADFLPSEIAGPLKRLQKEAPPMPFAVIRRQLERDLKKPVTVLVRRIDPRPYAAASIGQVHRGELHDGREVVIKVQYPGVAESCDTDLAQLKLALRMARLVKVDKAVLDDLFEEIRERLHEELDYIKEARNMDLFRGFFAADGRIVVPASVPELCSRHVLTMVLERGDSLDEVAAQYPQELRDELALRLFHFMARSVFDLQAVHADPNPANFAWRRDGSLVVYDFGCVKRLESASVAAYRETVRAGLGRDWPGVDRALARLGVRVPGSPPVEDAFYADMHDIVMRPFAGDEPFDFARSTMHQDVVARSSEFMRRLHQFQPPVATAYLDRMVGGHYWTLTRLGANVALGPVLREYLAKG